jgi:hypothetical protein
MSILRNPLAMAGDSTGLVESANGPFLGEINRLFSVADLVANVSVHLIYLGSI